MPQPHSRVHRRYRDSSHHVARIILGRSLGRVVLLVAFVAATAGAGCASYRRTAGCAVVASEGWAPEVHGYTSSGNNAAFPEHPIPIVCTSDPRRLVSPLDDLTTIREGSAVLDDGVHHACPPLGCKMTSEEPATAVKPCSATACDNLQYAIRGGPGTLHLLFYDDPSAHQTQGSATPGCYYRLWSVGFTWTGKSWE